MAKPFSSFVMFAEMRTGSNFLEAQLNALPGVSCMGEVFNPHFIGKKDQQEMLGVDLEMRESDPMLLLQRLRDSSKDLVGFRYFNNHDPRILPALLQDPGCAKIILTRNPVESYVSWKIAQATGQWKLTNVKNLKQAQVLFDADEFARHMERLQDFQILLLHGLQSSGQTAFYIDYEDINDLAVLNGLAAFLGVGARLEAADETLKKQNPEDLAAKVSNPEVMEQALARLDRFNLSRTPNFEPRRPAAIPSFVAAAGAPLLYMPLRGGPEARVKAWLAQLGQGGLTGDFTQKTLRQWKRANPGHRGFTVLRHPLLRAHVAFRELIISGRLAEQRAILVRAHKADLPPPGQPFLDDEQHRQAFMAFLRFARLSAAGQTGQKVDPHWASQTAVLQGFAVFQGPDLVIREERLAEGLRWLADELGLPSPPLPPAAEEVAALQQIWTPEMEEAAQEAWTRDFMGYGFGRWKN